MKKKLIEILAILCLIILVGCGSNTVGNAEYERFVQIYRGDEFKIVYDTGTKVQYSVSRGSYNHGTLTLLVDAEGKPLLYEEW